MNVFYVDKHPVRAAEQMCDKHIVKMILESAQLLSTCHRVLDGTEYYDKTKNGRKIKRWRHPNPNIEPLLYKAGWVKHPSTIWLFESAYNYIWLYKHMIALNDEYTDLYPFSEIVGNANILVMPGQHSAAISNKIMKTLGGAKVIGPLLIGLAQPIEIAPLRSSTSEILDLASVAAYSAGVIKYEKLG